MSAKVYTRTGDKGTSQLLTVGRVPKDHPRLIAYGDIDELNASIGVAIAAAPADPLPDWLGTTQDDLFVLGSQIAVPHPEKINTPIPQLEARHTEQLERWIDELDEQIEPLRSFILPGGSAAAAALHLSRTICRRCERLLQSLHQQETLAVEVLTYINRLSDLLFTAARYANARAGVADIPWKP